MRIAQILILRARVQVVKGVSRERKREQRVKGGSEQRVKKKEKKRAEREKKRGKEKRQKNGNAKAVRTMTVTL